MSAIILSSPRFVITEKLRKTSAKVFKDFNVGDIIEIKMQLRNTTGASGGGNYASYVRVYNLTQGTSISNSQSQLVSNLDAFKLEEATAIDNEQ